MQLGVERLAIEGGAPVRPTYLVFGKPVITEDEVSEVVASLRSGWLTTGPKVARLQQLICDYLGVRNAVALNSCTAAMHLALVVAGIGPGDEVITSPMTFAATANVIVHTGATPVFADCDRATMNVDPDEIERHITPRTRAIMPVHMAGRPCDMDSISAIAAERGLTVIEDAAHAFGAEYHGKKIGSLSPFTAFSFYATKNMITGEGGVVTTDDDETAAQLSLYSLHGMSRDAWKRYTADGYKHYLIEVPGFKYNMVDLQAAIGIHQIGRFEAMQQRREEIWRRYDEGLRDLRLDLPPPPEPGTVHARHLYTVSCRLEELTVDRDSIMVALHKENIGTSVHFIAVHLHPYYQRRFGFAPGSFPNAEYISERTLSLPLSAGLTFEDVDDVVAALRKVLSRYAR
jgi:dTDP-4-amino-4,6-dideoxygalactose transaminase